MQLSVTRVGALVRLLREMREIEASGGDSTAHAATGVVSLVGADAGGLVLMPSSNASAGSVVRTSLVGYAPSEEREVDEFYRHGQGEVVDVAASSLVAVDPAGSGVCRLRRQLIPDRRWYGSPFVHDYRKRWRLDDSIYGGTRSVDGNYAGIGLFRAWGRRPFDEEDARLAELFAEGCKGAVFASGGRLRPALSPRQEQTLQCLLTGDSAKQIAHKLGISVHTVGDYVKSVYRAHHVNSRAELLASVLGQRRR
jgi:DNA-binding CsgD family transcriptional regulator